MRLLAGLEISNQSEKMFATRLQLGYYLCNSVANSMMIHETGDNE
jgi:hypothetical protein